MQEGAHEPVLLAQVVDALQIRADGLYIDATFGRGGHARAILARLAAQGRVMAIDRDPEAIAAGMGLVTDDVRFALRRGRFGDLHDHADAWGVAGRVDGVLLDLGVSSPQLDSATRGFSFSADGPLDMRMDPDVGTSAAQWLAHATEQEIADTLYQLGDERHSRRIARRIVQTRRIDPIRTTAQLAALVSRALHAPRGRIHPATRTFQALRIRVNDEIGELERALAQSAQVLRPHGRLAVISFHSIEDRVVKRFIRAQTRDTTVPGPRLTAVGRLIRPDEDECRRNPRARSARMRVAERVA
ncbi:MAG: 16S rRNA (cytosine(1402)-N(4))-methyltransferase RsmH [Gammaproteobacteria bacterium]